jgi:hypothetical protein
MFMKRILLLAGLAVSAPFAVAQQDPPRSGGSGQSTATPTAGAGSIDGSWTVVSAARGGRAVDGADKMTVTIKDNVVTFSGGAAGGSGTGGTGTGGTGTGGTGTGGTGSFGTGGTAGGMRAVRLEFLTSGMLRVTEAGADGKFSGTGSGSSGTGGTGGTGTGGTAGTGGTSGGQSGTGSGSSGTGAMPQMNTHMSVVLKRVGSSG